MHQVPLASFPQDGSRRISWTDFKLQSYRTVGIVFCSRHSQSSKGHNKNNIYPRVMVLALCTSSTGEFNLIPMPKSLHTPLCIPTSAARYLMSKILTITAGINQQSMLNLPVKAILKILHNRNAVVKWTRPEYILVCGIALKLFTLCIDFYKNYITENLLQNFSEQYCNKLYTTNNRCYIF